MLSVVPPHTQCYPLPHEKRLFHFTLNFIDVDSSDGNVTKIP